MKISRRRFFRISVLTIISTGCEASPTVPSPVAPKSNRANPVDGSKVGRLVYSEKSPLTGKLDVVLKKLNFKPEIFTISSIDICTGQRFTGAIVTSLLGDPGPPGPNGSHLGWIITIGDGHYFANSVRDLEVNENEKINCYYGKHETTC